MTDSSAEETRPYEQPEWERIHERRERAFPGSQRSGEEPRNVVGLSLSGGGLRSAMFNDGFLQGLSHSGLLRYVDFLCSVSGGGYIAGHLATRARRKATKNAKRSTRAKGFHDDPGRPDAKASNVPARWALGRSPVNGEVDADRLSGVGRYLASKISIAPSFLWSVLLSALVLLGLTGVIATLLAMFWRSFDDPMFRVLSRNVLDFRFGGELAIAFYPSLLVLVGWFGVCLFGWFRNSEHQLTVNRIGLTLFLLSLLVSMAVFLGNGKSHTTRAGGGYVELNHYAQWLAVFAGVFQIFVFVGRDKLFRSERDESQYWQKAVQKVATSGVVIFAFFAMVHWMARENISGYSTQRGPYLVRGEVSSWPTLQRLSAAYESWQKDHASAENDSDAGEDDPEAGEKKQEVALAVPQRSIDNFSIGVDITNSGVNFADDWAQHQLINPLVPLTRGVPTHSEPTPPSPIIPNRQQTERAWTFWQRMVGFAQAYAYTRLTPDQSHFLPLEEKANDFVGSPETIHDYYMLAHYRWHQQRVFLKQFNEYLHQEEFSKFLQKIETIESVDAKSDADVGSKSEFAKQIVAPRMPNNLGNDVAAQVGMASANRKRLETIFPSALQDRSVPSTLVVPPHDQAVRLRWLAGWWTLFCMGVCLSVVRNQTITIYSYYRNRLSRLFLSAENSTKSAYNGSTPLHELQPTSDGLPHPLFLASRMTPCVIEGSYHVRNRPFVFSPIYCGDADNETIPTDQVQLPGVGKSPLMIADAVTISGAAVTPLMTDTRALSVVLSFFGDGLGQWLIGNPSPSERKSNFAATVRSMPLVGTLFCTAMIGAFAFGWYQLSHWFTILLMVLLTFAAFVVAVNHWSGICQFLASILAPVDVTEGDDSASFGAGGDTGDGSDCLGHVADGGFYDYLGVTELFRRKCSLIVVSDAGANLGNNSLAPLAKMCTEAAAQFGVKILDLDHNAPIDFGRLSIDKTKENERVVHQPYLVARIRYKDGAEGLLVYCQMAITKSDPIEIQQIRHRFPSFPDEPTTNQFYTDDQVAAYRNLGHHIATRMCSELFRWEPQDLKPEISTTATQPLFRVVRERILTAYRLACYQEQSYKSDDLFSEAIWATESFASQAFLRAIDSELLTPANIGDRTLTENWLRAYENNADIRAKYRHAVLRDINPTEGKVNSVCARLWGELRKRRVTHSTRHLSEPDINDRELLSAHLAAIAVACHEIHEGRPHAIFQVGGRQKLVAMMDSLREVLLKVSPKEEEFRLLTTVKRPSSESALRSAIKRCLSEILELEKCTFQDSERITTVSFAQCLVMMWGQLAKKQPLRNTQKRYGEIAQRIRSEGVEMAASNVRIELDQGLKEKELDRVLRAMEDGWCITFLPRNMVRRTASRQRPTKPARRKNTK